jgi:hypothetical protein
VFVNFVGVSKAMMGLIRSSFGVIPSYGVVKKVVQSDGFHEFFTFAIFYLNFQRRLMQ